MVQKGMALTKDCTLEGSTKGAGRELRVCCPLLKLLYRFRFLLPPWFQFSY